VRKSEDELTENSEPGDRVRDRETPSSFDVVLEEAV
jgi:hypothetical protein